ncbi:protein GVQW3-like [Hermetia illucens]|uniref:protein GVQW3-like n=1 Tax=Hermetia illucens TaxID=343691 RepID=UPI0018CC4A81|nr:protein GVQW3-like [Hermetia illucens]
MEKIEYRAVIKYLFLKGNTPTQIKAEFKRGRTSLGDDEGSGRPKTGTTDDNQMVPNDRRIKVRDTADAMNMSKERVCHIWNEDLGMKKLPARWVPRLLTLDQIRDRMNISNALLARLKCNKSEFWRRVMAVDET